MALLNGLLDTLLANHQDALLLRPGSTPRYQTQGAEVDAAAFVLDDTLILELLEEASPERLAPAPPAGLRHEFVKRHRGVEFGFAATATAEGWSLAVSPLPKGASLDEPRAARTPTQEPARATAVDEAPAPLAPTPDSLDADSEPTADGAGRSHGGNGRPAPAPGCSAAVVEPTTVSRTLTLPSIDEILADMLRRGASDLHLCARQSPRLRLDGELLKVDDWPKPGSEKLTALLAELMPLRNREQFEATNDTDFAHEIPGLGRFRVNVFRERHGVGAVFRHIPLEPLSFEDLGLPSVLRTLTMLPKGLVLVTGPTGSGKSTTLASMIHLINRTRRDHIITIEDPIEFVHESDQCMVTQREVGPHTGSFHHALRAALREDPDIVLVGEMRDLETMSTAIHTAETGHLVFGTLHTTSAPSTVERVIGQFPGDLQGQIRLMLAESLRAVISQTLLRKIGGGRVAAFEVLLGTPAVSNLIREGKTFQIASSMQTGKGLGMATLTDSLFSLVKQGLVEPDEAFSKAPFKEALAGKFEAAGIELPSAKSSELAA